LGVWACGRNGVWAYSSVLGGAANRTYGTHRTYGNRTYGSDLSVPSGAPPHRGLGHPYAVTPIRRHAPSLQLLDQSYPRHGSSSQRLDQLTRTFVLFRHLHAEQPRELGLEEKNGPEIWMLALQIV
jgi:hypothetical protein